LDSAVPLSQTSHCPIATLIPFGFQPAGRYAAFAGSVIQAGCFAGPHRDAAGAAVADRKDTVNPLHAQRLPEDDPSARPPLPAFAVRLRQTRRNRGLSQRALAAKAGLPVYRIEEIEQGRWPKGHYLKTLLSLARALGVQPSDLDDRLKHEA